MGMEDLKHEFEESSQVAKPFSIDAFLGHLNHKKMRVLDGYEDAYKLAIDLKVVKVMIEDIEKEIKKQVVNEVFSEPIQTSGYRIETFSTGRYKYDHNPEWVKINLEKQALEESMKKACKMKDLLIDHETQLKFIPAIYESSEPSYKITKVFTSK